ncbi:MAG: hypothetical protein ABSG68_13170 [Thermoguttaceae bacterium]|jgi:hypothetical protein
MRRFRRTELLLGVAFALASVTAGVCVTGARLAGAAEPADKFLDALRRRGYYDEAAAYLEQMRHSPLASKRFQEAIDYELAVTLGESARSDGPIAQRQQRLGEAQQRLAKFLKEHPGHPAAAGAQTVLANLLIDEGRLKTHEAAQAARTAAEKPVLWAAARALFHQADGVLDGVEKRCDESHKKLGYVDPKDIKKLDERDQVRRDLLQARLSRAGVFYDITRTYEPGTAEHKAALAESAMKYRELFEKHGERLAGLYARLGQGICLKELGEANKAFAIFEELMAWPNEPEAFRTMKTKAAVQALETALLPGATKLKEALALAQDWERTSATGEASAKEGLSIKYLAGEVALAWARGLKAEDRDAARSRGDLLKTAREEFAIVAGAAGPYQQKARVRLLDPLLAAEAKRAEPHTFVEASDRTKAALERISEAEAEDQRAKTAEEHDKWRKRSADARAEALRYGRLALKLKSRAVADDDLNAIRYSLAYLYYKAGNMYEAAVLGEFLARHDANRAQAADGARVAMAAYAALFREAGEDRQFEIAHLLQIADFVAGHFSGEADADEARLLLLQTAAAEGKLPQAIEYLGQIRPESARRAEAELSVGQAFWSAYLRSPRLPETLRPKGPDLAHLLQEGQRLLKDGVERLRKAVESGGEASYPLMAGVLSLAQMSLATGDPEQALRWLEDPKIGVKTLLDGKRAAVPGSLPVEACKALVQAYVALQRWDLAERTMQDLERLVGKQGDAEGSRRLIQIYIGLGRDMQEQLQRLRSDGKVEELARLSQTFETFLTRIAARKEGNTFRSLDWVAETYLGMGAGFDPGGGKLPSEAEKYYRRAADTFRTILQRCEAEKNFAAQPEAVIAVRIRLARCLRRLGAHQEALGLLVAVLKERATLVDAQIEAAYTYQAWGEEKPAYFSLAISGSQKYREVWGWAQLARRLAASAKHKDAFHEARYNLALCRFRLAQSQAEAGERDRQLKLTESEILMVQSLYPDMGGKAWYDKYDELLVKIQKLRDERPLGLKATAPKPAVKT